MKNEDVLRRILAGNGSGFALVLALGLGLTPVSADDQPAPGNPPVFFPAGPPSSRQVMDPPTSGATTTTFGDGWTVHVVPGQAPAPTYQGRTYNEIYDSIPYRKSEHLANPSYRHDSTMEIMFGELRPTVIHRDQSQMMAPSPAMAPMYPPMYPWRPYNLGSGSLWNYSAPVLRHIFPFFPYPIIP